MDENYELIKASNNKFYKISIINIKNEIISIKCESKDLEYLNIIPPKNYSTIDYKIDDLKELNKYFKGFDTIEDVYDELENHKKNKNIQLLVEDNNNLILNIPLNSPYYKELKFELKRVELDYTKATDDLYEKIGKLMNENQEKISELTFEIENLKNQKGVMENDFNEKLNNLIKNLKDEKNKEITDLKKEIQKLNNLVNSLNNEKNNEIKQLRKEKYALEEKNKKDMEKFIKDVRGEKNKEIEQIKNEICEQNKQNKKLIDVLKDNMKKIFFFFKSRKN